MPKSKMYWLELDSFNGGVNVPESMTSDMLHRDLTKLIGTKAGVFGIKKDEEFRKHFERAEKKTWTGVIKEKLETCWEWDEFQEFWKEKMVKNIKGNSEKKDHQSHSQKNIVKEEPKEIIPAKEEEKSKDVSEAAVQKKSNEKEKAPERIDMAEAESDKYVKLLQEINKELDVEINHLQKELENKKANVKRHADLAVDDADKEVKQDKTIKGNAKKIKKNERKIKGNQEKKLKEEADMKIKASEVLIKETLQKVSENKEYIEAVVPRMKNKRNREMRLKKLGFKNDTLRMIQNSKKAFTIVDMYKEGPWVQQPVDFQTDLNKLQNVKKLNMEEASLDTVTGMVVEQKIAAVDEKEEIGVMVLKINKEEFDTDDDELFRVDVDSFVTSLGTTVGQMSKIFGRVAIVIPPAKKEESKILENLSESIEKEMSGEVMVKNLWREQELLIKREEGKTDGAEKFIEENSESLSKYSVRRIISWMANISEEETGEEHHTCDDCGLIHFTALCPPEVKAREKEDGPRVNKSSASGQAENEMEEKNEENATGKDGSRKIDKEGKNERKRGRTKSRSRTPPRKRSRSDERKVNKKKPRSRERFRSRSPRRREDLKDRDANFNEQCYKCLRDHTMIKCKVKFYMKCGFCEEPGHNKKIHEAKKPETIQALKNMYGPDFEFL